MGNPYDGGQVLVSTIPTLPTHARPSNAKPYRRAMRGAMFAEHYHYESGKAFSVLRRAAMVAAEP